jgi:hypothetical protein
MPARSFREITGRAGEQARGLGMWAIASNTDFKVPGMITWRTRSGWRLSVQQPLSPYGVFDDTRPVIVGVTSDGTEMTLLRAAKINELRSGGLDDESFEQEYGPSAVFVGARLPSPDDRRFARAAFSFTHLSAWLDERLNTPPLREGQELRPNVLTDLIATVPGGVVHAISSFVESHGMDRFALTRESWFRVEGDHPRTWTEWRREFLGPLSVLLDVATFLPNAPESIRFELPPDPDRPEVPPDEVRIVYELARAPEKNPRRPIRQQLLFTAKELPIPFAQFMPTWFEIHAKFRDPLILGIGATHDNVGYLENRFLNVIEAAETYHRISYPDATLIDQDEYDRKWSEALTGAKGKVLKWAKKQRLRNEPYLEVRLTEILTSAQPEVAFQGDPAQIAALVAATRNYLTHRSEKARARAAGTTGQVWLMWTVWFATLAEILKVIGFESALIRERLGRNWRCKALRTRDLLAGQDDADE